jgi:hypothetical protein
MQRQAYGRTGSTAGHIVDLDLSSVFADDAVGEVEPETRATPGFLGGEEGLESAFANLIGDPGSLIAD